MWETEICLHATMSQQHLSHLIQLELSLLRQPVVHLFSPTPLFSLGVLTTNDLSIDTQVLTLSTCLNIHIIMIQMTNNYLVAIIKPSRWYSGNGLGCDKNLLCLIFNTSSSVYSYNTSAVIIF